MFIIIDGTVLKEHSFKDVAEYLNRNGMTPIPTTDGQKIPYRSITKNFIAAFHGTNPEEDSFHIPLPPRVSTAKTAIKTACTETEAREGMGIGATFSKGWHDRNFVVVDLDGDYWGLINSLFVRYPTFACRGKRGVKLVYAIDSEEKINYKYVGPAGGIDVFGNWKHLAVFWGEHPKSTPNNSIRYTQTLDHDIPTLKWDEFKAELTEMALCDGFTISEKKIKVEDKSDLINRKGSRSFNLLRIGIEEAIQPSDSELTQPPHGHNCTHPVHGSAGGNKNLTYNTLNDQWYCAACESGGGILQWMAVKYGLVNCWDCTGISPVKGDVWRKLMVCLIEDGYFTYFDYGNWVKGDKK